MFADHQPRIGSWARANADNLREVIRFAILTIQEPLYRVPDNLRAVHDNSPDVDGILFGHKKRAWLMAGVKADAHHWHCTDIWEAYECGEATEGETARALVTYLASEVEGLGLAKAGFVAQLAFGVGGCLDTHNLKRFNLPPKAFDHFRRLRTAKARRAKVDRYLSICESVGGCAYLWDSWCEYVATASMFADRYRDAEHVSAIHCEALGV